MTYAAHFPKPLQLELLRPTRLKGWRRFICFWRQSRRRFMLLAPFSFVRPNRIVVEAPTGAVVDGASHPVSCYRLIGPPWGEYAEATVIHDWLWNEAKAGRCTFTYANLVFWEAMTACVPPGGNRLQRVWRRWRRWLMWAAVTINARLRR